MTEHSQSVVCGLQCGDFQDLSGVLGRSNVKHPLLDKVRRCSAEPEEAAKFFGMVLFPGVGVQAHWWHNMHHTSIA